MAMLVTRRLATGAIARRLPAAAATTAHSGQHRCCSGASASPSWSVLERTLRNAATEAQASPLTTALLAQSLRNYLARTPSANAAVNAFLTSAPSSSSSSSSGSSSGATPVQPNSMSHDHYAYRTIGLPGLGIASMAQVLQELGYTLQEEGLLFPAKKLTASWFAFTGSRSTTRRRETTLMPRVFVSEIQVERLSAGSQAIIKEHLAGAGLLDGRSLGAAEVATAVTTGTLPWPALTADQYQALLKESDYAAWVLMHGYTLNHTALAVHNMVGPSGQVGGLSLQDAAAAMKAHGLEMNHDGGLIKVSGDGLLRQCSTMSDGVPGVFATTTSAGPPEVVVPGSYLELVERAPLPQHAHLKASELHEWQRRDGFEIANAAHLFTSTRAAASATAAAS